MWDASSAVYPAPTQPLASFLSASLSSSSSSSSSFSGVHFVLFMSWVVRSVRFLTCTSHFVVVVIEAVIYMKVGTNLGATGCACVCVCACSVVLHVFVCAHSSEVFMMNLSKTLGGLDLPSGYKHKNTNPKPHLLVCPNLGKRDGSD